MADIDVDIGRRDRDMDSDGDGTNEKHQAEMIILTEGTLAPPCLPP